MKSFVFFLLLTFLSLGTYADIIPVDKESCVPVMINLRVTNINLDENYNGERAIRVTFKSRTQGLHEFVFTQEHLTWGMALISYLQPRDGDMQKIVSIACKDNLGYDISINLSVDKK